LEFGWEFARLPPDEVFKIDRERSRWVDGFDFEDDGDGLGRAIKRALEVVEGSGVIEALGGLLKALFGDDCAGFYSAGCFECSLSVGCDAVEDDVLHGVLGRGGGCSE
jgi:hypothetical protein